MLKIKLVVLGEKFKHLGLGNVYFLDGNKLYDGDVWIGTITAEEAFTCFETSN